MPKPKKFQRVASEFVINVHGHDIDGDPTKAPLVHVRREWITANAADMLDAKGARKLALALIAAADFADGLT